MIEVFSLGDGVAWIFEIWMFLEHGKISDADFWRKKFTSGSLTIIHWNFFRASPVGTKDWNIKSVV